MDFSKVIEHVCGRLDAAGIRYALIGGFAMALRGVQRATMDIDFILMLEDMEKADGILSACGYRREFHSENVSHYQAPDKEWGRIDILHAFRKPTLGMLQRAERVAVDAALTLPVVHVEDLVGLKIQALVNDPSRAIADWDDIRMLLQAAGQQRRPLDWGLVLDYLRLFRQEHRLEEMKSIYGTPE
jgi:hypothetical protein